jgi:hypothetical protein
VSAEIDDLRRELAGCQERENCTLTDSEAFRAGFTEGNLAHLHGEPHPLLSYGWGGLDELLERREAELRGKLAAAEQARDRLRDLALDACAVIDGGGAYCCDCDIGTKADTLRADIEAVPRG